MAKKRGGKRYARKKVYPGGAKRLPYEIEIVEVYVKIDGKKHSSSYSIARHGVREANRLADAWLAEKRALAAQADARRAKP